MGWLSSLFGGNEIEELERIIRETPAPSAFIRLAQLHMEHGNAIKGAEQARKGLELFPESEELRQSLAEASHASQLAEVDQIKGKIERFPNPTLYARLASLYLEQNDLDNCTRTCTISIKSFPEYAGIYLVMAQVSRKRQQMDKVIHYLEKATELDAFNYAAHMMLAEELVSRGQTDEARLRLGMILRFAPDDERVRAMLAGLNENAAPASASHGEEDTRRLATLPHGGETPGGPALDTSLAAVTGLEGVQAGLLVDQAGLIVACRCQEQGFDEELAAAVVSNVCRAVHESAADLGIGDFLEANIEGDFGTLQLMPVNGMVLAAFAGPSVRSGRLQRAMHGCIQELAAS